MAFGNCLGFSSLAGKMCPNQPQRPGLGTPCQSLWSVEQRGKEQKPEGGPDDTPGCSPLLINDQTKGETKIQNQADMEAKELSRGIWGTAGHLGSWVQGSLGGFRKNPLPRCVWCLGWGAVRGPDTEQAAQNESGYDV